MKSVKYCFVVIFILLISDIYPVVGMFSRMKAIMRAFRGAGKQNIATYTLKMSRSPFGEILHRTKQRGRINANPKDMYLAARCLLESR